MRMAIANAELSKGYCMANLSVTPVEVQQAIVEMVKKYHGITVEASTINFDLSVDRDDGASFDGATMPIKVEIKPAKA